MARSNSSRSAKSGRTRSSGAASSRRSRTTDKKTSSTKQSPAAAGALGINAADYVGLVLVVAGILVGLAVYANLAGVVGRGLELFIGWVAGVGRYLVPVGLVVGGFALIRDHKSAHPARMFGGVVLVAWSILGLVHLASDATGFDDLDGVYQAGGWLGALAGVPLEAAIATAGAVVVLLAVLIGGVLLVTRTSLASLLDHTTTMVTQVTKPVGTAAKKAVSDLASLSDGDPESRPGPDGDQPGWRAHRPEHAETHSDGPGDSTAPALFDGAEHDGAVFAKSETVASKAPTRKPKISTGSRASTNLSDGDKVGEWELPSLKYLNRAGTQKIDMKAVEARGQTLQASLAEHKVETELIGMTVGPTVTRYELELGPGVKVAKVTNLQKDIAYAMAATDVRILAPIPGRSAIGVEVPNHQRQLVALGDLLSSEEAEKATHPLEVAVGKDIAGKSVFLDIATTPHMLIAGATGAGKSSGINCIITSLLMRTTPDQVRLILIDPKQVEMGQYSKLPHLLTEPVTNPKKAANALGWAVKEMERRYDVLSEVGFRDIGGYNQAWEAGTIEPPAGVAPEDSPYEHMPYIVVVVDELNDLMMVAARDVEESITRIAQKARAVGIHLIIATQRPSVNVITGVIKANVPARMAFAVSSLTDSRVILDQPGAEKLVGKGDMLLLPGNSSVPHRIQGSFVSEEEVRQIVKHWHAQAPEPIYSDNVEGDDGEAGAGATHAADQLSLDGSSIGFATSDAAPGAISSLLTGAGSLDVTSDENAFSAQEEDEDTVMRRQAMELVVRSQLGSTSMLQRKLKVGFARAGRIMDELEEMGVVGPSEGSKARTVLITVEEYELLVQAGKV